MFFTNRSFEHGSSREEVYSETWQQLAVGRNPTEIEGGLIQAENLLKGASSAQEHHQLDTNNNAIGSKPNDYGAVKNELQKPPEEEQRNREPDADTIKMYAILITFGFFIFLLHFTLFKIVGCIPCCPRFVRVHHKCVLDQTCGKELSAPGLGRCKRDDRYWLKSTDSRLESPA